jgi:hypothetical protein
MLTQAAINRKRRDLMLIDGLHQIRAVLTRSIKNRHLSRSFQWQF